MRDKETILKQKKDALKKMEMAYKETLTGINLTHQSMKPFYIAN